MPKSFLPWFHCLWHTVLEKLFCVFLYSHRQHFWHQMCEFSIHQAILWYQLGIPQFSSASTRRQRQIPQVKVSIPEDSLAPVSYDYCECPDLPAINGSSHDLCLGFDNLLEWHTELMKTPTYVYRFIIRDITKDTDEQPDPEIHLGKVWKGLLSLWSQCAALPACVYMFTNLQALSPIFLGFLWRRHQVGIINY